MKSRRPSRLERPGSNGRSSRQKTALVDNKTRHDSAAENGTPEFHAHTRFTPETGGAPQCDAHPRPGHRHPHGHSNVAEPRWDPKASVGSEAKECLQQETLRTATAVGSQMELNQESQKLRALGTSEMHPQKSEFAEQWEKDGKESTTVIRFERSRRVGTSCRRGTCGLGRKDRNGKGQKIGPTTKLSDGTGWCRSDTLTHVLVSCNSGAVTWVLVQSNLRVVRW
jgi:hypothetical protein